MILADIPAATSVFLDLSGDALVVAIMQAYRITQLASHDADFDRVTGLMRFAPT